MADTNYSVLLEGYLKAKFGIRINQVERSWFKLPSGAIIYVNGSKLLVTQEDSYGWCDLGSKEHERLVTNPNCYYVIILDKLELSFILPHNKVKEIFSEITPGNDYEWHYKLRKKMVTTFSGQVMIIVTLETFTMLKTF
jgi:hypothetical protein